MTGQCLSFFELGPVLRGEIWNAAAFVSVVFGRQDICTLRFMVSLKQFVIAPPSKAELKVLPSLRRLSPCDYVSQFFTAIISVTGFV